MMAIQNDSPPSTPQKVEEANNVDRSNNLESPDVSPILPSKKQERLQSLSEEELYLDQYVSRSSYPTSPTSFEKIRSEESSDLFEVDLFLNRSSSGINLDDKESIDEYESSLETTPFNGPSISSSPTTPIVAKLGSYIPPHSEPKRIQHPNQQNFILQEDATSSKSSSPRSPVGIGLKIPLTEPKKNKHKKKHMSRLDLADSPRNKSFSANDILSGNAPDYSRREELLKRVKANCDQELQQFLEYLENQLKTIIFDSERKQDYFDTMNKLKEYAKVMTELSTDEIIDGRCKELVDKVQQLQQFCFTKRWVWKENVTKLLLIISRVSRLVEHLDLEVTVNRSKSTSRPELPSSLPPSNQENSFTRKKTHTVSNVVSSKAQASSLEESPAKDKSKETVFSFFLDKVKRWTKFDKKGESPSTSPVEAKSLFNLRTSTERNIPKHESLPQPVSCSSAPVIMDPPVPYPLTRTRSELDLPLELLCRICEELVPSDQLETHSRHCAIESKNDMKVSSCDERIAKFIKAIERKILEQSSDTPKSKFSQKDISYLTELKECLSSALEVNVNTKGADKALLVVMDRIRRFSESREKASTTAAEEFIKVYNDRITDILNEKFNLYFDIVNNKVALGKTPSKQTNKPRLSDFQILKPISKGAFGKVFLAKKKKTGDLYAIKVLNKSDLRHKNQVSHIKSERSILASTQNPFLVKFYYSFQTKKNLYMVMEYLNGGDLYSLLKNLCAFDEQMTRMYIAEVILSLEYIHSKSIIHRDLKPDNLLVGQDGHIKLTDFGLSRYAYYDHIYSDVSGSPPVSAWLANEGPFEFSPTFSPPNSPPMSPQNHVRRTRGNTARRYSFVGTPDYLAPEVILGTGHGKAVDWWALGVIMFEFLTGIPPFNAETPQAVFENILNRNIPPVKIPEEMSSDAFDLINKLLTTSPEQRLGANGAGEVKAHKFFKGIDWNNLLNQEAVFIPHVKDIQDTSYFDETRGKFDFDFDSEYEDEPVGAPDDFVNFSFKHLPNLEALNKKLMNMDTPNISPRPPQAPV